MFFALTLIAYFYTLAADWYIYKTRFSRYKFLWIFQSLLFNLPPLVNSILHYFVDNRNSEWVLISMWILWLFIIQFILKFFVSLAVFVKDKTGKSFICPSIFLSLFFVCVYLYGTFVSRCEITINKVDIVSSDVPEEFDGYTIAQFSDTHIGTMFLDKDLLNRVVDTINSLSPDLIIQSGDLVHIHVNELTSERINTLKRLKLPVFAVMGNHDLGFYLRDTLNESPKVTIDALTAIEEDTLHWTILRNENRIIRRGNDSMYISGVTYPDDLNSHNFNSTYGGSDIKKAMHGIKDEDFSILVSHTPVLIDSLPEKSSVVDLMLSGHVHAMQLKIGNFCPSFMLYRESSGMYNKNNVILYVNDGIGVVGHPFRFGAPPEVTLFKLKKQ